MTKTGDNNIYPDGMPKDEAIRSLSKEYQSAGVNSVQWNGRDQNNSIIPVGIYILRFVYKSDQGLIIQERKVVYTH